jgi:hypothetical protein
MSKIAFLLILSISCSLNKVTKELPIISSAHVFSSFDKAGTTASIRMSYSELKQQEELKHKLSKEQLDELNKILKTMKYKKTMQQKIGVIEKGIEVCDADACYCLVLTRSQLIDVSRNYEYDLTNEAYHKLIAIF